MGFVVYNIQSTRTRHGAHDVRPIQRLPYAEVSQLEIIIRPEGDVYHLPYSFVHGKIYVREDVLSQGELEVLISKLVHRLEDTLPLDISTVRAIFNDVFPDVELHRCAVEADNCYCFRAYKFIFSAIGVEPDP